MKMTQKDEQGNWSLKGIKWDQLHVGQTITKELSDKLYGALWKLMKYEDTGLTPEEILDGKLLTGWIPVGEQLPEDGIEVLVTIDGYECQKYDKIPSFSSTDVYVAREWQNWNGVIAWMPLPEPYQP